ncbi:ureidoglycolate lyase [Anaerobium acetethylicum]|uniref:Ureidoglycolate lyase n=1 Tax=Anaerobium acetethylicum TaxID=1619234 RepID=A0A1D3TY00_9FIRM|nr:ureidoglycolate lyase [Anaerobium acetethylicum]SCP99274.1 ureidoglycolate lyase [Anaerobium acetethylicum]
MKKIKIKSLTAEAFNGYGSFYDLINPTGHNLGDFYHDHILYPVSGNQPIGFSTLISKKSDEMIVKKAEYHNYTSEIILPLDGDIIVYVAPPSKNPVPELAEAFLVPQGTMIKLNTGVWHMCPFSVEDITHIMVALPERVYSNDCSVVEYAEEQYIEIIM